jgi:hypothetical protein
MILVDNDGGLNLWELLTDNPSTRGLQERGEVAMPEIYPFEELVGQPWTRILSFC